MESTPQQPHSDDDWLLSPSPSTTAAAEERREAEPVEVQPTQALPAPAAALGDGRKNAAGLVAGVLGSFALGHHGSGTTTFQPAGNSTQQLPGGPGLQDGGTMNGGPMGGGMSGEQHLQGTLTAVGTSSITVQAGSSTATYSVTSSTQVVRDGRSAKLSDLRKGDVVLVHVITLNGKETVERVIAGTMSQGSFPGGPGGPGGFAPGQSVTTQPGGVVNS